MAGTLAGGMLAGGTPARAARDAAAAAADGLAAEFARIERRSGGRLGVAVLDTGSGARAGHRDAERFPMCSTFKTLAGSAVLARVDAGLESLDRRVRFGRDDLVTYSPATEARAGGEGMTVAELCEAAITISDNTAANLLLASLGGPAGLTAHARALGDGVTRLDRDEPTLNEAAPGDPRDTTTPAAMASDLRALVLGEALSAPSRARLAAWLLGSRTNAAKLRAGVPATWRVGSKTGSGGRGTSNDAGVLWPPGRPPLVVCAYLTETQAPPVERDAANAAVARAAAAAFGA